MENNIDVYIKLGENGVIPKYGSINAAGCDLYAASDLVIRPGEIKVLSLDFIMAIPEDCEAQVRPRSGLSLKTTLRIPNSPGTIDADYRDTVGVIIENNYSIENLPYEIIKSPELIEILDKEYREVSLSEIVKSNSNCSILNNKIYLDKNDNPYGSIYIKKGERIAQMIFCKYKRANFIEHENPKAIGENRGGGFGHTGI